MGSNKAIICLTRGYQDVRGYKSLILRNVAIYNNLNHDKGYPLVIFHEGNINKPQQQYIIDRSLGQNITFVDISDTWSGGYEGMCKFFIYDVWFYCQKMGIEYMLRIDEDCVLQKIVYSPFDQLINRPNLVYLTSVFWAESHSETNATLPAFIKEITGVDNLDFYNDKYPYTNVSLASVSFMIQLKHYLNHVVKTPLQRQNRWGDLPVLGSLLNIFAKDKVGTMSGLSYYHASHNMSINCE